MTKSIKKEVKENKKVKKNKNIIDSVVYWLVQIAFAVFATAGISTYLKPVDPILSLPITLLLVGLLFYVGLKNR